MTRAAYSQQQAVEPEGPEAEARLSTDYLNRYSEALMLLEMAGEDPEMARELAGWRAVGYREHFEGSALRCAPSALAAYAGLEPGRRARFDALCQAMNRLIASASALLAELPAGRRFDAVLALAGEALRELISRATLFVNGNGRIDIADLPHRDLQREIDAVLAGRAG